MCRTFTQLRLQSAAGKPERKVRDKGENKRERRKCRYIQFLPTSSLPLNIMFRYTAALTKSFRNFWELKKKKSDVATKGKEEREVKVESLWYVIVHVYFSRERENKWKTEQVGRVLKKKKFLFDAAFCVWRRLVLFHGDLYTFYFFSLFPFIFLHLCILKNWEGKGKGGWEKGWEVVSR